jgi:hypothetical protein
MHYNPYSSQLRPNLISSNLIGLLLRINSYALALACVPFIS